MSSMMCGMLLGAGVNAKKTYVDDVFSTFLYEGNSASQSINNGIDLAGEGGMVWAKRRSGSQNHILADTVRGITKYLNPNGTAAEVTDQERFLSVSSTGFAVGDEVDTNGSSSTYSSWTFRKAKGFFDIVTYTGNDTNRTIAHNLGCVPGCIIVKRLNADRNWIVYHVSVGNQKYLNLNNDYDATTSSSRWNNTTPTSSVFSVGESSDVNGNGDEYVAYLFANDEQSFGEDENASVIKCGSYTGNGSSTGPEINLGFEPQWIMVKNADSSSRDWIIWDSMRGIVSGGNDERLKPNSSEAEGANNAIDLTSTGFKIVNTAANWNENNKKIVYVAIRRPDGYVGKPAEAGTDVFAMDTGNSSSTIPTFDSGFPVDFAFERTYASTQSWYTGARLISGKYLTLNGTGAEGNASDHTFDSNTGWQKSGYNTTHQSWMWKRHAGFDVVTYTGNGVAGRQIPHSLNKSVEMIWLKSRSHTNPWMVYHKGLDGGTNPSHKYLQLNSTSAESDASVIWNDTAPTANHFTIGSHSYVNADAYTYLAMLFASVEGISKVGSYAGSDSAQTITTGFQPRFVLIKNASVGSQYTNWYVLDTTRGWTQGGWNDDKYLELNDDDAQANFDFGYPTSNGFYLTGNSESYNQGDNTFIYYAHA